MRLLLLLRRREVKSGANDLGGEGEGSCTVLYEAEINVVCLVVGFIFGPFILRLFLEHM